MCFDAVNQSEAGVFINSSPAAAGAQDSGGSARTDYRAIQLAKKKKQRGPPASSSSEPPLPPSPLPPPPPPPAKCLTVTVVLLGSGASGSSHRKCKAAKASVALSAARYSEGGAAANGGLTLRDPITGAQYVQIQLLQVRPPPRCRPPLDRLSHVLIRLLSRRTTPPATETWRSS